MSELLDRIGREIRERLEASRAAVLEHERLEAALRALSGAGSRATHAVTGRGQSTRATAAPRRSSGPSKPSTRARSSKQRASASGADTRAARARAGGAASARARRSSGTAAAGGGRERSRARAGGRSRSVRVDKREADAGAAAAPVRKRAARGANRQAVLRVISERPGVTARELAGSSQVAAGTLNTLLRRLTDEGTLEKRELPGGQSGYALAAGETAAEPAGAQSEAATTQANAAAESAVAAAPEPDRADSSQTGDTARSAPTDTQAE